MIRSVRVLLLVGAALAVAAFAAACGTEHIKVSKSAGSTYSGALLFAQRCSGCHTLSYAGTHGSAPNVRTAQSNSGPNFDQRCERPIDRVLYAIENGGFSGAYMPQNIVVGQDAVAVARFVATYAGRSAPKIVGLPICEHKPIGTLPAASAGATTAASASTTSSTTKTASAPPRKSKKHKKSARS